MQQESYYEELYRLRRELREADSLLSRIAVHLDQATRAAIQPLRSAILFDLTAVVDRLYK